tara:strand:- start:469 stop:1128 length:660 start_codon:yes stop_codon:yes gene_type:complete
MIFLINSNKLYYQITTPVLIKSLVASGIDKKNIIVVAGGCENSITTTIDGVEHRMVNHDSFDMTSFIYVVENDVDFTSFFYLHDTCEVGKTFYSDVVKILEKQKPTKCMRLKNGASMNIGWYDVKTVKQHKDRIVEQKNLDLSNKGLQTAKSNAVDEEDLVFSLIGGKMCKFTTRDPIITKMTELYGNTTDRRCEFYDEINLKKYKKHWARANQYRIGI